MTQWKRYGLWGVFSLFVALLWVGLFYTVPKAITTAQDYIQERVDDITATLDADIDASTLTQRQKDYVINRIKIAGLEEALAYFSEDMDLPMKMGNGSSIIAVKTEGTVLIYTYEQPVGFEQENNNDWGVSSRKDLAIRTCFNPPYTVALEHGATIELIDVRPDGSEIGRITFTQKFCEKHAQN